MRAPRRGPGTPAARLTVTLAAVMAVLLVAVAAAGCGGEKPLTKVTLQLNWLHEAEFAGYYAAQAKGFYKDQGLDVTIVEGGPGAAGPRPGHERRGRRSP